MTHRSARWFAGPLVALIALQAGCATLVQDPRSSPPAQAKRCEGTGVITSTHMATLPIPVVAFFTPRVTLNAPDSNAVLNQNCGGKQQVNRKVQQNYAVCAPTIFLTTIITLGIAGVCPRIVSWEADVVN